MLNKAKTYTLGNKKHRLLLLVLLKDLSYFVSLQEMQSYMHLQEMHGRYSTIGQQL